VLLVAEERVGADLRGESSMGLATPSVVEVKGNLSRWSCSSRAFCFAFSLSFLAAFFSDDFFGSALLASVMTAASPATQLLSQQVSQPRAVYNRCTNQANMD
jgi:hypothetical protein